MPRRIRVRLCLILSVMLAPSLVTGLPAGATAHGWTATGLMSACEYHTATRLLDGRVLVTGGFNGGGSTPEAQIYDPASGTWTSTASMAESRQGHTATRLPDGRVLVAGGYDEDKGWLASAEIYDPASGTWSPTGSMSVRRVSHTATLLRDGRVLVAGGPVAASPDAEIYDPASGTWSQS